MGRPRRRRGEPRGPLLSLDFAWGDPLTPTYWAYLGRHRDKLEKVQRMTLPMKAEARRAPAQKKADREVFERTREALLDAPTE